MTRADTRRISATLFVLSTLISATIILLFHPTVTDAISIRYPGDSFHTLSGTAAAGLVLLCIVLVSLTLMVSWLASTAWIAYATPGNGLKRLLFFGLDLFLTLSIYMVLLTLVPQIFYSYYHLIFENLPVQWVIKPLPADTLNRLMQLRAEGSMSEHLAGVTGWVLLTNLLINWLLKTWRRQ